tara:strand:- start:1941 stop:2261 length:321 start_codon:yes stop_codon:yes gene_type:complete
MNAFEKSEKLEAKTAIISYFFYFVLLFFIHERYLPNMLGWIYFLIYLFFVLRGLVKFITTRSGYEKEYMDLASKIALNDILLGLIGCGISGLGSYWIATLELGIWR